MCVHQEEKQQTTDRVLFFSLLKSPSTNEKEEENAGPAQTNIPKWYANGTTKPASCGTASLKLPPGRTNEPERKAGKEKNIPQTKQ